jgi:hypothetical protein
MKVPGSILALFLFGVCASAQVSSNLPPGPEVTILQKKWRMDVRNPALEKDPLASSKQHEQEVAAQRADARENENRSRMGEPALPPRVRASAPETEPRGLSILYIYEVKVRNTGAKEIRTLTWEYEFSEPGTERVVGRLRMVSNVSIGPGKTRNVVVRTTSSPTGTIDATKAGKKPQDQYSDRVVIKAVRYADGSVWQAPSN